MRLDELTRELRHEADALAPADTERGRRAVATRVKRRRLIDGSLLVAGLLVVTALATFLVADGGRDDTGFTTGPVELPRLVPAPVDGTKPWNYTARPAPESAGPAVPAPSQLWLWSADQPFDPLTSRAMSVVVVWPDPERERVTPVEPLIPPRQGDDILRPGDALRIERETPDGVVLAFGRDVDAGALRALADATRPGPGRTVTLPERPEGMSPVVTAMPTDVPYRPTSTTVRDADQPSYGLGLVADDDHTSPRAFVQVEALDADEAKATPWLFGAVAQHRREATVHGRPGWLLEYVSPAGASNPSTQVATWIERPGIVVTVTSYYPDVVTAQALADGLHEADDAEWERWTRLAGLERAVCPAPDAPPEACVLPGDGRTTFSGQGQAVPVPEPTSSPTTR